MTQDIPATAEFLRISGLARSFTDRTFRASYMAQHLRAFLADQIRGLRGDLSQTAFGRLINKPQSVVSRLEDEEYGKVSLQTLLDIAQDLDVGLLIRFVDFPTFLKVTADFSDAAIVPHPYNQKEMEAFLDYEQSQVVLRNQTLITNPQPQNAGLVSSTILWRPLGTINVSCSHSPSVFGTIEPASGPGHSANNSLLGLAKTVATNVIEPSLLEQTFLLPQIAGSTESFDQELARKDEEIQRLSDELRLLRSQRVTQPGPPSGMPHLKLVA